MAARKSKKPAKTMSLMAAMKPGSSMRIFRSKDSSDTRIWCEQPSKESLQDIRAAKLYERTMHRRKGYATVEAMFRALGI